MSYYVITGNKFWACLRCILCPSQWCQSYTVAHNLVKNKKVLDEWSMEYRTTASYKMKFGLKKFVEDKTLEKFRQVPFSSNIDEARISTQKSKVPYSE